MFELLKKHTTKKAGFEMNNRGDCELLSALILEVTDIHISYNTLRRFFGLDNYVKPSKSTLDALAKFNGYDDYVQFLTNNPLEAYWIQKEKLYGILHLGPETIINYLNQLDLNSKDTLDIIISLCRELVYLNKIEDLDIILRSNFFNQIKFNYSELLHFGSSVGILFQNNKATKQILTNNTFLNNVYCIFVDYSQLNGYYGGWTEYIIENNSDSQIRSFSMAIRQLKNYLNNKPIVYSEFKAIDSSKFHPILKGRLYSIKILCEGYLNEEISLMFYEILQRNSKDFVWDYFYELIFTAILSRNFLLMAAIKTILSKQKINTKYYQDQHQKIYQLMCEYYNCWFNYECLKGIQIKNQELMSFEYKYGYNEIIQLFITILNYHYEAGSKERHLKKFLTQSKKLNYPLFSKNYLINYFEK
jgi:hypothetical protein